MSFRFFKSLQWQALNSLEPTLRKPYKPEFPTNRQEFQHSSSKFRSVWSLLAGSIAPSFRTATWLAPPLAFCLSILFSVNVAAQEKTNFYFHSELTPSGLKIDSEFRLLFVSESPKTASQAEINTLEPENRVYNILIKKEVTRSGHKDLKAHASKFRVLGSTAHYFAYSNTQTDPRSVGVPIYWVGGDKVADNNKDFYDGTWYSKNPTNQAGKKLPESNVTVHTGSTKEGIASDNVIGDKKRVYKPESVYYDIITNENTTYGKPKVGKPFNASHGSNTSTRYFYGLSPVFIVVPTLLEFQGPSSSQSIAEGEELSLRINPTGTAPKNITLTVTIKDDANADFLDPADEGKKEIKFERKNVDGEIYYEYKIQTQVKPFAAQNGKIIVTVDDKKIPEGFKIKQGSSNVVNFNVKDDPTKNHPNLGMTLNASRSSITEGGTIEYTLTLASQATKDLNVEVQITAEDVKLGTPDSTGSIPILGTGKTTVRIPKDETTKKFKVKTLFDINSSNNGKIIAEVKSTEPLSRNLPQKKEVTVNNFTIILGLEESRQSKEKNTEGGERTLLIVPKGRLNANNLLDPFPFTITLEENESADNLDDSLEGKKSISLKKLCTDEIDPNICRYEYKIQTRVDPFSAEDGEITVTVDETKLPGGVEFDASNKVSFTVTDDTTINHPALTLTAENSSIDESRFVEYTLELDKTPTKNYSVDVKITAEDVKLGSTGITSGKQYLGVGTETITIPEGKTTAKFTVITLFDPVNKKNGKIIAEVKSTVPPSRNLPLKEEVNVNNVIPTLELRDHADCTKEAQCKEGDERALRIYADKYAYANITLTLTVADDDEIDFLDPAQKGVKKVTLKRQEKGSVRFYYYEYKFPTKAAPYSTEDGEITVTVDDTKLPEGFILKPNTSKKVVFTVKDEPTRNHPILKMTPNMTSITEGDQILYTLVLDRVQTEDYSVEVDISTDKVLLKPAGTTGSIPILGEGKTTVTIPKGTTTKQFYVNTKTDRFKYKDGKVIAEVKGTTPPSRELPGKKEVTVTDRKLTLSYKEQQIVNLTNDEGEFRTLWIIPQGHKSYDDLPDKLTFKVSLEDDANSDFLPADLEGDQTIIVKKTNTGGHGDRYEYQIQTQVDPYSIVDGEVTVTFKNLPPGFYFEPESTKKVVLTIRDNTENHPDLGLTITTNALSAIVNEDNVNPFTGGNIGFVLGVKNIPEGEVYAEILITAEDALVEPGQEKLDKYNPRLGLGETRLKLDTTNKNSGIYFTQFYVNVAVDATSDNDGKVHARVVGTQPFSRNLAKKMATAVVKNSPQYTNRILEVSDTKVEEGNNAVFDLEIGEAPMGNATLRIEVLEKADLKLAGVTSALAKHSTDCTDTTKDFCTTSKAWDFTWPSGKTASQVKIPTIDNQVHEFDKVFGLKISVKSGKLVLPNNAKEIIALATITDDTDFPVLNINSPSVMEGNEWQGSGVTNKLNFDLALNNASEKKVRVRLRDTGLGTATAGNIADKDGAFANNDYETITSRVIEFAPGVTSKSVKVAIKGDLEEEKDETVFLRLIRPVNVMFPDGNNSLDWIGTILNDDHSPTSLKLTGPGLVSEGRNAVFRVEFINPEFAPECTFIWSTLVGTATGADYTAVSSSKFTISKDNPGVDLTVPTTSDLLSEGEESFTLEIHGDENSPAACQRLRNDKKASATITDNPTIFVKDAEKVTEGQPMEFPVDLSFKSANDVSLTWKTLDDSAKAGSDYTAVASGSLVIPAGETEGIIQVTTLQDQIDEDDEKLSINIESVSGGVKITRGSAHGLIRDDDARPKITIDEALVVNEGDTTTLTVNLSKESQREVTASWLTREGTAREGADYTKAKGNLVFKPGETTASFTIETLDDSHDEKVEVFHVLLFHSPAGKHQLGKARIVIEDNDMDQVSIQDADPVTEADGTTVNFKVNLSKEQSYETKVKWETVDGTGDYAARGGGSYDDFVQESGTLTFPIHETEGTIKVTINNDDTAEHTETFGVMLTSADIIGSKKEIGIGRATGIGQIKDDDAIHYFIANTNREVREGNNVTVRIGRNKKASVEHRFRICIRGINSDNPFGTTTISNVDTYPGLASVHSGQDDVRVSARHSQLNDCLVRGEVGGFRTIKFAPDDLEKTITVHTIQDERIEGDESFMVDIATGGLWGSYQLRKYNILTGPAGAFTIIDDDSHRLRAVPRQSTLWEGQKAIYDIHVDPPLKQGESATVEYSTEDGTARGGNPPNCEQLAENDSNGFDYEKQVNKVLSLTPGAPEGVIEIQTCNEHIKKQAYEPDESFTIELSNPTLSSPSMPGAKLDLPAAGGHIFEANIQDDDRSLLELDDAVVDEGETAIIVIRLSEARREDAVVTWETVAVKGGAETSGALADFTPVTGGTVTITAGQTRGEIEVSTIEDSKEEFDEDFQVQVTKISLPNFSIAADPATVTIRDDDDVKYTFSGLENVSVPENEKWSSAIPELDGDTPHGVVTWTIEGADKKFFRIRAKIGELRLRSPLNFEDPQDSDQDNIYEVTVRVTDEDGNTGTQDLTLTVTNVDTVQIQRVGAKAYEESKSLRFDLIRVSGTSKKEKVTLNWSTMPDDTGLYPADGNDYRFVQDESEEIPSRSVGEYFETLIKNDLIDEPDETVKIRLSDLSDGVTDDAVFVGSDGNVITSGVLEFVVTILDDDDPPTVSIVDATAITEGNDPATTVDMKFAVNLSRESSKPVEVPFTVSGDATAGSDYNAPAEDASLLTIAPGNNSAEIAIPVKGDTVDEHNETIIVTLTDPPTNASIATDQDAGSASGIITDDDATTVTLEATTDAIAESAETKTITVTLGRPLTGDETLNVPINFSGTAAFGTDYTLTSPNTTPTGVSYSNLTSTDPAKNPPTIRFTGVENAVSSATLTLTTTADNMDEEDESVSLSLGTLADDNTLDGGASGSGSPEFNITDDSDPPILSVDAPSVTEGESGTTTTLTFKVNLNATSSKEVTVDYAELADGTATQNSDYDALTAGTLSFPAGETEQTIDIIVNGDAIDEEDETVIIQLSAAANATFPDDAKTMDGTGTISDDDDAPMVSVANADAVTEGNDTDTTESMSFAVTLSGVSSREVTVPYTLSGTATSGSDYEIPKPLTITIPAGDTTGEIVIPVKGDTVDEPDESIGLELGPPTNASVSTIKDSGTASGTITDDDVTSLILARVGSGSIAEDGGSTEITLTLGRALIAGEKVTAPLTVTGGTVSTHYKLTLKNGDDTGVSIDTSGPHSDQHPAVILSGKDAQTATLIITAVANNDILFRTLAIAYGKGARAPPSTLSGGITTTGSASVPIKDDDAIVSTASAIASEGDDVEFTVTLPEAAPSGGVTIGYSTKDGRGNVDDASYQIATSTDDYTAAAENATITIAQDQSSGIISIATTDDDTYEGDHYFTLTLDSTTLYNLSDTDGSAIGTISDAEDRPTFAFSTAESTTAAEDDGTVSLTVSKTGKTLVASSVDYATTDGTATDTSDFTAISSTELNFAAADSSKDITVNLTDDSTDETTETFTVDLTAGDHAQLGSPSSHIINITDNDATTVILSVPNNNAIIENGGTKTITVTLGRPLVGAEILEVPLTFSGTAKFGTDYTLATPDKTPTGVSYSNLASTDLATNPPTISFSGIDGAASSTTIILTAIADTTDEGASESVTVGLGTLDKDSGTNLDGGASGSGTAALNITDGNTKPTVTLLLDPASIDESGDDNATTITASLSGLSSEDVTLTIAATPLEPAEAGDFKHIGTTLTIPAGETTSTGTVIITAVDNKVDAPNKSVTVSATAEGGNGVANPDDVTLTITDDDTRGITVAPVALTLAEVDDPLTQNKTEHQKTYTVELDSAPTGTVTVNLASSDTTIATLSGNSLEFSASDWDAQTVTVTAVADDIDNADDERTVRITHRVSAAATDYADETAAPVAVTVTDDEGAPILSIDAPSVAEGDDGTATLTFKVALAPVSGKAVRVHYADAGTGTATSATDYAAITAGTLNFAAGDTEKTVDVTINGDSLDELDETVILRLSAASNASLDGGGQTLDGTGTITDDDAAPTVSVANASAVTEGNDSKATTNMSFTVSLSAASGQAVTVPYTLSGTATATDDYTDPATKEVEIAAGASSGTIVIPVKGDTVDEPDETIIVTLGAPTNASIATTEGAGTATGTINDDDAAPTVSVANASAVNEGNDPKITTNMSFTVSLSAASGQAVTVPYTLSGTATATDDYTDPATKEVEIAAGTRSAAINIPVKGDVLDEPAETIIVTLGVPTNATVASGKGTATGTITDDDATPTATLELSSAAISENGGTSTITASLSGATSEVVTLTIAATPVDPAVAGDMTLSATKTLTIAAGATTSTGTVIITAVDNKVDAPNKSVTVSATAEGGNGVANPDDVTLTITDDDEPVSFAIAGAEATEGGKVAFIVTRSGAEGNVASVKIKTAAATSDGAKPAATDDYTAITTARTLNFAKGVTSHTVEVQTTQDDLFEPDETFLASLSAPALAEGDPGTGISIATDKGTATGTIKNDDIQPSFAVADASAAEGEAMTFTVTRSGARDNAVSVKWNTKAATGNGAASSSDYTEQTTATKLDFAKGVVTQTFTVATTEDNLFEGNETFLVELTEAEGGTITTAEATGTITDDDAAPTGITLSVDTNGATSGTPSTVAEDAGPTGVIVTATVNGTTRYVDAKTIAVSVVDNTAASPADYAEVSSFNITIAAGAASQTGSFTLTPVDDALDEVNETIAVTGTLHTITITGASITITDDDIRGITVVGSSLAMAEVDNSETDKHENQASYTIVLTSQPTDDVRIDLTVPSIVTVNPTALTFTPSNWNVAQTVTVTAVNDDKDNASDVRTGTITHQVVAGSSDYGDQTATSVSVTVNDDDGDPSLSIDAPSVAEGDDGTATLTFTITLAPVSGKAVRVHYADAGTGTATSGEDYAAITAGTLNFAAGETEKTVDVTINGDSLNEPNETVILRLSAVSNAALTGGKTTLDGTGTINDDDAAPTVSVANASAVTEGNDSKATTNMSFTVSLSAASGQAVTVPYTLSGTATATDDYTDPATKSIKIAAGTRSGTIVIPVKGDTVDEPDETIIVTLGVPTNASIATTEGAGTATGTINDDDATPTATLELSSAAISENGGTSTITASLSGATSAAVTLTVAAPPGATTLSATKTLTIAAGATTSTGTVIITAVDNKVDAPNKSVAISATATGGNGVADPDDVTLTITDDDEAPTELNIKVSLAKDKTSSKVAENVQTPPTITVTASLAGEVTSSTVQTVTVTVGDEDDSATVVADYKAVDKFDITIPAESSSGTGSFTFTPVNDAVDEDDETVSINGALADDDPVALASITITDDDTRGITVAPVALTLAEVDDPLTQNKTEHQKTYTVELDSAPTGTVTVNLASSDTTIATLSGNSLEFSASDWDAQTVTVTAVADDIDNADDERTVRITHRVSAAATDYADETAAPVAVTVTDDEGAPILSIDAPSVAEGDDGTATLTFKVALAPVSGKAVRVHYADAGTGTATSATDYAAITAGTLNFAAGDTEKTVDVTINGDSLDELDETVILRLSAASNASLDGGGQTLDGTGTITDDDAAPTVSVANASAVTEGNDSKATTNMSFTVSLSAASGQAVTVPYTLSGTATATDDYTDPATKEVEIAAGASSGTIVIPVKGDTVDEPDETIIVTLGAPTNASIATTEGAGTATGTINDDDAAPTVSVANASAVNEGNDPKITTNMSFTVSLSAASGQAVTVPYTLSGTATATDDYTDPATKEVEIAAGASSATIVIPVKGDVLDEPAETIIVTLGVPTNASIATTEGAGTATGTITDDDATPTATLELSSAAISENGGTSTITASLSGATSEVVTLTIAATPVDPAVAGDMTLSATKTLTIAAGATTSTGTVIITAVDNKVDAPNKSVTVSATAEGGNGVANPDDVTLTITDDDEPVSFAIAGAEATEGGKVAFIVTRSGAEGNVASVKIKTAAATSDGAKPAATDDYTAITTARTLNFAKGVTSHTVEVQTTQDDLFEPDETFLASLSAPALAEGDPGTGISIATDKGTATGTIKNDDIQPSFAVADASAAEGEAMTFTVTRSGARDNAVSVKWNTKAATGNGAASSSDYTEQTTATKLDFAKGVVTQTFTVATTEDNLFEGNETFLVELTEAEGGTITTAEATGTITDDDAAPTGITLSVDTNGATSGTPSTVAEDAGPTGVIVTATVNGTTRYVDAKTIAVSVVDNTAASPADYAEVSSFNITIAAGAASQTGSFTLTPVDDALDEVNETIAVTGTLHTITITGASITITDDDIRGITVVGSSLAMAEVDNSETDKHENQASYTIVLTSQPTDDVRIDLTVPSIVTVNPTALTFTPSNWNVAQTVTVTAVNDDKDNASDVRTGTITHQVVAGSSDYGDQTATSVSVTVNDDDGDPSLSIDAPSVAEGDDGTATLTFTITLAPVSGKAVRVHYADAGTGTATSGEDYAAITAGTLNFAAGETEKTVDVTINGDSLNEPNETVILRLSAVSNAALTGGKTTLDGTGTINDDDAAPTVSVANASAVTEGNDSKATTNMSFTVSLSAASGQAVTVPYTLSGTATATDDYTDPATKSIKIAAGTRSGTIVIPVKGDTVDEPDETIIVTLGVPTNASIATTEGAGTATGTINDDDATPTATLELSSAAISENGGTSTITASLSGATSAAVTLTVAAPPGATTLSATKTLTIAAGATTSTGTVIITAVDNKVDAPNKSVAISATATGGNGVADPDDVTLTITDDDEAPTELNIKVSLAKDKTSSKVAENVQTPPTITVTASLAGEVTSSTVQTVTVTVGDEDDSATVVADYKAVDKFDITIPAESSSGTGSFTFTPVNDAVDEDDETVSINGALADDDPVALASITITDDDTRGITVAPVALTLAEVDDPLTQNKTEHQKTYTVELDSAPTGTVTVNLASSDTTIATLSGNSLEFSASDWMTARPP